MRRCSAPRTSLAHVASWSTTPAACSPHRCSTPPRTAGMRCTSPTCAMCCCARSGWRERLVDAGLPGSVINVTSIEGVRAAPGYAAYAAAKAGVINYTKTAALELATHRDPGQRARPGPDRHRRAAAGVTRRSARRRRAHDSDGPAGTRRRNGRCGSVSRIRHVQLHHRPDDPRRRRNAGRKRLVPQPADRRLPAGARVSQCVQPSAACSSKVRSMRPKRR